MANLASLPRWNDVLATKGQMFKWLHNPSLNAVGSIVLLRHDKTILPTILMRYPDRVFREPIDGLTPSSVQFDVVTVLPFPTPLAYVFLVIFDEYEEPCFFITCLKLFPFSGIGEPDELTAAPEASTAREIVKYLCQSPARCGVIVFNEEFCLRKAQIITITRPDEVRRREIAEVIEFLGGFNIDRDYSNFAAPVDLLNELFCASVPIPYSENREIVVGSGSSLAATGDHVFSIRVANNRLIDRRSVIHSAKRLKPKYDVFISHAHADSQQAHELANWLKQAFPRIRVALTKPGSDELFAMNPNYFIKDSKRARCLLYLFTPNSCHRPMVDTEIGINCDKPIIPLLLGTQPHDLDEKLRNNLFLWVDRSKAILLESEEASRKLADSLAAILSRPVPQKLPAISVLQPVTSAPDDVGKLTEYYVNDYHFMRGDIHKMESQGIVRLLWLLLWRWFRR